MGLQISCLTCFLMKTESVSLVCLLYLFRLWLGFFAFNTFNTTFLLAVTYLFSIIKAKGWGETKFLVHSSGYCLFSTFKTVYASWNQMRTSKLSFVFLDVHFSWSRSPWLTSICFWSELCYCVHCCLLTKKIQGLIRVICPKGSHLFHNYKSTL